MLPEDVVVLTISMDLPLAQARWRQMPISATKYSRRTGQRNSDAAMGF